MKNFKKVIAFLMAAAMTLGMGTVAFAAEAETRVEALGVDKIEAAAAGETVTIRVLTKQTLSWNAGKLEIVLDPEYVKTGRDDVISEANGYLDDVWKLLAAGTANYTPDDYKFACSAAGVSATNPKRFQVEAGTTVAELNVVLAKDVAEGDKIATVHCDFITDSSGEADVDILPQDVEVVISAKSAQSSSDDEQSSSSDNTQSSSANTTEGTNASAATAATSASAASAIKTDGNDIVTKDDALNALDTLAKATAAAAKLNKSAFASDADYQAFTAALAAANKVLSNSKATDAEKAAALATLKAAMAKADEKALVAAVKAVVNATPATTKSGNGKTKTGDTAPVAALMLVAIAAFGTAVVVYRKKVNA